MEWLDKLDSLRWVCWPLDHAPGNPIGVEVEV